MSKNKEEGVVEEQLENAEASTDQETTEKKAKKKKLSPTAKLKAEVEELNIQLAESKDKHLRLFAEFDNFKKRNIKEKIEFMQTASSGTMRALLPVLDDFDRAKKSAEDDSSIEQFSEGVMIVYNKIHSVLKGLGLEPMVSTNETFDPELHEAVTEIPAPSEEMKGKVIDTIETGYRLKDKIIRHAKVVVGK